MTPCFRAGDLIKNLLLSVFLERSVRFQDEVYTKFWSRKMQRLMGTDYFIGKFYTMNFATIYLKIVTLEMFLSQHDESVTSPEQVETFTDDRLTGLQLYGKFHGYYESLSREEPNLETVHVKIIKQLEKFAENFENK